METRRGKRVLTDDLEFYIIELAELREKWDRDERSAREYYKNTAFKEGREAGMQAGIEKNKKK